MKLNDTIIPLQTGLKDKLGIHGFKLKSKTNDFRRESSGVAEKFMLLYVKQAGDIKVEPVIAIKVHEIEDLCHKVASKSLKEFQLLKEILNEYYVFWLLRGFLFNISLRNSDSSTDFTNGHLVLSAQFS